MLWIIQSRKGAGLMTDRRRKPGTTLYLLRDIPVDLWRRARSRALLEGQTIREVILDLLDDYAPTGGFVERSKRKPRQRKARKS
jgi:hypothetical protein